MSASAPLPDVPPSAAAAEGERRSPTPDLAPFPIELVDVIELEEPGSSCRLDGTCD